MLLVETVTGPAAALAGDTVGYRVTAFNVPHPSAEDTAAVRWLIKSTDGGVLAHMLGQGAALDLTVPDGWRGHVLLVMPYFKSPSAAISVRTSIAGAETAAAAPIAAGVRQVDVVRESSRYYAAVDGDPRFFLGTDVRYGTRRGLMNSGNPPGPRYR